MEASRLLPDVPIAIAGEGPLRATLEMDAPASVKFLGQRSGEELQRLRRDAVATVSPSTWYENAPMSVLESMRDGRAAIVTDIGGQPELVAGGGGLAVKPGDCGALADAIARLWRDRSLAAQMGAAARRRLVEEYTLDRHVTALEAMYAEVCSKLDG